ncbi:MAG: OmpA family protein [Chitinophagaceae bacterium]|nr:OmpA family protein [Chitinophagaceae bacterium]
MKRILFLSCFCLLHTLAIAQLGDLLKRKAGEGVKQGAQNATEKGIDKLFKKKNKKEENKNTDDNNQPKFASQTEKPSATIKAYSKYDFIPGEKILAYDDFMKDAAGDFPVQWNTNASGEIMTVDNYEGHWLNISKEGYYVPKFIKSLPENFTLEYDLIFLPPQQSQGPNTDVIASQFITLADSKKPFEYYTDRGYFETDPYLNNVNIASYTKTGDKLLENQFNVKGIQRQKLFTYHIAVWRQKTRLRVYFNETKVVDAPSLLAEDIKYNAFRFATSLNNDGSTWLISNFKFASGLPDTRNKLLTAGKFSTTGILFATNSSSIQPQSYGTLKDIATVLKENAEVKIKIVGHTDNDGDDAANLDLSKKRAEAVKAILAKEFGIDENRMQTDGKGETQPAVPNTSAEGKAQNRRVEFIKM